MQKKYKINGEKKKRFRMNLLISAASVALLLLAGTAAAQVQIDLWNHATAYRYEYAVATFTLDPAETIVGGELNLTAYNSDTIYVRAIYFTIAGEGGYIGTYQVAPGQVYGEGIIFPGETKNWNYDLSSVMIADGSRPEGYRYVNFINILNDLAQTSTPVEVVAWVSSYDAGCWITASMDLQLDQPIETPYTDPQDVPEPQMDIKDIVMHNDGSNYIFGISIYDDEILLQSKKCWIWTTGPDAHDFGIRIEPDGTISKFFDNEETDDFSVTIEGNMYEFVIPKVLLGSPESIDFYVGSWLPDVLKIDRAPDYGHLRYNWQVYHIPAEIDFDPDVLSLTSNGMYVTVLIELNEGYDVRDIDISTTMLNGQVPAERTPTEIQDNDIDGIPDLMVKFDRSAVQEILEVGDKTEIEITGKLTTGGTFVGTDTIKVINNPQ